MSYKNHILLIGFYIFWQLNFSQSNVEFQQLIGENVSTQSIIYDVEQDSIGNIWIASEEGILKHNSKFYKTYNTYDGLPEIVSNRTTEIFIDSKQRIWIGLENGICLYDKILDKFNLIGNNNDINPSLVNKIVEDQKGNIWIGGFNGLWKYNPNSTEDKILRIISNQNVQTIYANGDELYLGTPKGLFVYNSGNDILNEIGPNTLNVDVISKINHEIIIGSKTGELFMVNLENDVLEPITFQNPHKFPITDICNDQKGNIYIATNGDGLFYLDSEFSVLNHYVNDPDDVYSISSNGIYSIELGQEGILWIATYGGGINYINSNRLPFLKIQHKINNKNSIVTNFTRAIAIDKNQNLWFGTKKGTSIWNTKNNSWKHLENLSSSSTTTKDIVLSLQPDENYMWIGTYNDGLFRVNINNFNVVHYDSDLTKQITIKKVYAICKDSKNNIWFGGIEGDLTVLRQDNSVETYPIRNINSIKESKSGNILAVGRNGVYEINDTKKEFVLIEKTRSNKNNLAFSTLTAINEIDSHKLVLASNGAGLIFYDTKNETIKKLNMSSGLPSDIIQGLVIQDKDNIWASTTRGLAHIITTATDTTINVYDKRDGLASTEFNYGGYAKLNDSLFAFAGVDGVTLFNPYKIKGFNYRPFVVFDDFKLFNEIVKPGETEVLKRHINETKEIVLANKQNSIELKFTGITHGTPSKVNYSWKLEGFDIDWTSPSNNASAIYTNLSSGNYTFRVKASDKYGNFGDERTIDITVLSPWWATNNAFIVYVFVGIGIVLLIIHFTSVVVKKRNADEQINFFNNITHEIKTPLTILLSSLDNVTESSKSNDESKRRIKSTVKRINSLFEQMLNFQRFTSVDNLPLDISKIDLEEYFKKRINNFSPLTKERDIEIIVNSKWDDPYFYFDKDIFDKILLNLISNAIKYSYDKGKIKIFLYKTTLKELKIEIIDYGLGIPKDQQKFILNRYYRARNVINSQKPGTGLGLMMVKKLLEKTGGTINFTSEENKGTTFTVVLKNLKFEYDKKISSLDSTINNTNNIIEDQSEIDEFSDSKILIVEDNDELRGLLVNTLGVHFQTFEAINGKQGLEIASQVYPDIILTDLIMPEMDGMEMSRKLKDDINLNHIPVIMLTVLQNSEQKLESIEIGISEYIEKPVDMKFLLAKLINTLKWQKKLREKYIHDNESDNASLFRNKNDQEFLRSLEEKIIDDIENESFSVHDLSASFNMSRTSLYMKLKNLVDLSPQDFIIHTRLKFAKKLLIEGNYSIKEVAYHSGFSNPKYFSTSFKKFYKMTPSGFIDSLKKE